MARPAKKRRRARFIVLGLVAAGAAAVLGYRQRELSRNGTVFDETYG